MRIAGLQPMVVSALLLASAVADEPLTDTERSMHAAATAAEPTARFEIKRSKHFSIVHNCDADVLRPLMLRIERTYAAVERFGRVAGARMTEPDERLAVLLFDDPQQFYRYGKSVGYEAVTGTYGFYHLENNRSAFFNVDRAPDVVKLRRQIEQHRGRLAALRRRDRAAGRERAKQVRAAENRVQGHIDRVNCLVLQHETAHQVIFNLGIQKAGVQNPLWLAEGLAMLFETPPTRSGAGAGAINQYRLYDFRTMAKDGSFASLKRLVTDPSFVDPSSRTAQVGYAQAWGLLYYLQRTRHEKVGAYLNRLAARPPGREFDAEAEWRDFEETIGPLPADFERRWIEYILKLPFRPGEIGVPRGRAR